MKKPGEKVQRRLNLGLANSVERHQWFFNAGWNEHHKALENWRREEKKNEHPDSSVV